MVLDIANPSERTAQICQRASLGYVITTTTLGDDLNEACYAKQICLDSPQTSDLLASCSQLNANLELLAESPAFAYFTSGSTGTPKGALNSHLGAVNAMQAMANELGLNQHDRVLQFAALGFDVVIEECCRLGLVALRWYCETKRACSVPHSCKRCCNAIRYGLRTDGQLLVTLGGVLEHARVLSPGDTAHRDFGQRSLTDERLQKMASL